MPTTVYGSLSRWHGQCPCICKRGACLPAEKQRLNLTESIDYLPPNSKVYRQWLRGQPHRWGFLHAEARHIGDMRMS